MPEEVMKLADEVVRDAKYVQVGSAGGPAKSITHTVENVAASEKTEWLAKFLRRADGPVLVFMRTKSGADRLAKKLAAFGLKAAALHADRTQAQRTQAVEGFRSGTYRVLVATDVAARGLDIDGISYVVNSVPSNRETHVRVGRTGRGSHRHGADARRPSCERCRHCNARSASDGDDGRYQPACAGPSATRPRHPPAAGSRSVSRRRS
jgi:ATP-dependent RNA helicase RhlE